jgi:hypothetical protein
MSNSVSRYRRKVVKQKMREKHADEATKELKDKLVNMSEEELDELAERVAEAVGVDIEDVREGNVKVGESDGE